MNLVQSIMTGFVAAIGFYVISYLLGELSSDVVLLILSFFVGLLITCTSLIIYEIRKLEEKIGKK